MPDLDGQVDDIEDDVLRLDLPVLPPRPDRRVPCRADAASGRRAHHRRDRPRVPGQRVLHGSAHLASQEDPVRGSRRVRAAHRAGADPASRRRDGRDLPDLQRGLHGHRRPGLDAPRPGERGDEARTDAGRSSLPTSPRCSGSRRCWRSRARGWPPVEGEGEPVLLEAQDRSRWDTMLIRRGLAALQQAELLAARGRPVGKYFLQASIAAQHARAGRAEDTNWRRIAALYDVLADAAPGPVVEVNRAVAHGRAFGPDAGLAVLDGTGRPCPRRLAARAQRARQTCSNGPGCTRRRAEAFTEAAARTRNESERAVLHRRATENRTLRSTTR